MSTVCDDPVSVALIEASLEKSPVSAVFESKLPCNLDLSTRAQFIWVVPPQLISELKLVPQLVPELSDSLPETATLVF